MKILIKKPWFENMKHNWENLGENLNKKTKCSLISPNSFSLKKKKNKLNKTKEMWLKLYSKDQTSFLSKDKKKRFCNKKSKPLIPSWSILVEPRYKKF